MLSKGENIYKTLSKGEDIYKIEAIVESKIVDLGSLLP
jgi:hypothetical protein